MRSRLIKLLLIFLVTAATVVCSTGDLSSVVRADDNYVYFLYDAVCFDEDEFMVMIPYVAVASGYWGPTAYFNRQDFSAEYGSDYQMNSNKVNPRYSGTYGLIALILEDELTEGNEEFVLTFTSGDFLNDPANGYYGSCTVTIIDNDGVSDPDSCILTSTSMIPASSSLMSAGGMSFEIQHIVEITDSSTAGLGWELILNVDDTIDLAQNLVDDPCIPGNDGYIMAGIPTELCISSITLTSLEFPDSTIDDTDVEADLTNMQSANGVFSITAAEDNSGDTGVFIAVIKIIVNYDKWMPDGTILTAGGNGSRFDGDAADAGDNEYVVQPGDKIQIFAGNYSCGFEYEANRLSTP